MYNSSGRIYTQPLSTGTENRAADADVGGTELNGGLKVSRHTHTETLEAKLVGHLGEKREVNGGLFIDRRNAHQAGNLEFELITAHGDE